MPNADTFSMTPVKSVLHTYLVPGMEIVDPFARNSKIGTITNDLDPATSADCHALAEDFVADLPAGIADAVLFDPPYSPTQISRVYKSVGLQVGREQTQNGRMYKNVKDGLDRVLRPGGLAISFGWNSGGFGVGRGYEMVEILLVNHGGAHNDTIVTVERKL